MNQDTQYRGNSNPIDTYLQAIASGDDERADEAAIQIAKLGKDATAILAPLAKSPDPNTRWWVLRTLSAIPDPKSQDLLIEALTDKDLSVRQCAALGLSQQPTPKAISSLLALLKEKDALLRRLAGDALIALGKEAVPFLEEVLSSGAQPARLEAARALAIIGDKHAIPALYQAWEEGSTLVKYWAEEGLDRMGEGMTFFKPG